MNPSASACDATMRAKVELFCTVNPHARAFSKHFNQFVRKIHTRVHFPNILTSLYGKSTRACIYRTKQRLKCSENAKLAQNRTNVRKITPPLHLTVQP